jgi:pimeloyl-ACP methyl ester carboxylesterase
LLVAGCVAGVAAAKPVLAAEPAPCWLPGLETEALCGAVQRPLLPGRGDSPAIAIHYAVLPALARNKHPDPLFFFAGGPGQSAIELAGPLSRLFARINNRRDVVLVDQRGTGRSAPLACGDDPPTRPMAEAADLEAQVRRLQQCRQRLTSLPHGDLRGFTTSIAMQDVDAVRAALGAQRINLVGASYGTRAALEYLRQYPARVRRVVLDGIVPPDMQLPTASAADNQAALDAMVARCTAEAACAGRYPTLARDWKALLASLPREARIRHPVTGVEETVPITRGALLGLVRQPLYVPALASALPLAVAEAAAGRFEALVGLGLSLGSRRGAPAQGMHFSVVCSEDVPSNADGPPLAGDFGDTYPAFYRQVCADWPRGDVPAEFRRIPPAAVPVWLLSGGLDPATPPRHGQRVAAALGPRARHTVVAHAGHGVLTTGCARDLVFRFLDTPADDEALTIDASCVERVPAPPAYLRPAAPR